MHAHGRWLLGSGLTLVLFGALSSGVAREVPVVSAEVTIARDQLITEEVGPYLKLLLDGEVHPEWAPGTPDLPATIIHLILPPGYAPAGLSIDTGPELVVSDKHLPFPAQPVQPLSEPVPKAFVPPDAEAYAVTTPASRGEIERVQSLRGHTLAAIRLHPVRYEPSTGELLLTGQMRVRLELKPAAASPLASAAALASPAAAPFTRLVQDLVANPEDLASPSPAGFLPAGPTVDYLIITESALTNAFQVLADHRAAFNGWATEIVTVTDITAAYAGIDTQAKIRECIRNYVTNHALTYVVLGGDNTIVPDRNTQVNVSDYHESAMPTDLYYSGLDGTWDEDGDGIYGEANYSGSADEGDLAFDVVVGRIPVRTSSQALTYIHKVIGYESTNRPPMAHGRKTLLMGDKLWDSYAGTDRPSDLINDGLSEFQNHTPVTDAEIWQRRAYRDDIVPHWIANHDYALFTDSQTSWDSASPGDYLQNSSHLVDRLNEHWAYVNMYTHGNVTIWGLESGSFGTSAAASLTGLSAIVYTEACLTGYFDSSTDPCLSEAFVRNAQGAVIYIGSSRYGWGSPGSYYGGPSSSYAQKFTEQVFELQEINIGFAFARHKLALSGSAGIDGSYRWLQFSLNLQGDPGVTVSLLDPAITLTSPADGAEVKAGQSLTVATDMQAGMDPVTGVTLRVNGSLANHQSGPGPASFAWTPPSVGPYDLLAVAHGQSGAEYLSSIVRITAVDNRSPVVTLTSPADGLIAEPGQVITVGASAVDPDGVITQLALLQGGSSLLVLPGSSASTPVTLPSEGTETFAAVAWDNEGASATSAVAAVLIAPDYLTELFATGRPFDLDGTALTFTPDGFGSYALCAEPVDALPYPATLGTAQTLSDDGSVALQLTNGLSLRLFAQSYSSVFLNSNGSITPNGASSDYSESLNDHYADPRISLLFDDLNPSAGGTVRVVQTMDALVVTFDSVPEYGQSSGNTMQLAWYADGTIRMAWLGVAASDGLVGLSDGSGTPPDYQPSDFSAGGPCADGSPPDLVSAVPLGRETVVLTFDEPLEPVSAATLAHYGCGSGMPGAVVPVAGSPDQVRLYIDGLGSGVQTVTVSGVEDLPGNVLGSDQASFTSLATEPGDADADGMPDWFEEVYHGSSTGMDPDGDADGDGQRNREEWITGHDPGNPWSFFQLDGVSACTPALGRSMAWEGVAGRVYDVYWQPIGGDTLVLIDEGVSAAEAACADHTPRDGQTGQYQIRVRLENP